jgi:hypothetical protein
MSQDTLAKYIVWSVIILLISGAMYSRFVLVCERDWSCMRADQVVYVKGQK